MITWINTSTSYSQFKRRQLKERVLNHYPNERGIACACCGQEHIEFLTIHHINGNGADHCREISKNWKSVRGLTARLASKPGSSQMYKWIEKHHYPPGFGILCINCNFSYGAYGYCPHGECEIGHIENTEIKINPQRSLFDYASDRLM